MISEPPLSSSSPCLIRSRLTILIAGFFLAASPLASAEAVYYDGSDPAMLATDPLYHSGNSLFPSNDVSGNNVTVSGATVTGITSGAANYSRDVSGNTLTVSNGQVNIVHGGQSWDGNSSGNSVNMSDSTSSDVYGGSSIMADAFGNTVRVNGGSANDVYGGYTSHKDVSGNTIIVSGTRVQNLYGGYGGNDADGNTVTATDTSINGSVTGGWSDSGKSSNNTVNVTRGSIRNFVYGGYSSYGMGESSGNTVTLTDVEVGMTVFGGRSRAEAASNNAVTLSGGSTVGVAGGSGNEATGNTVTVTGSAISTYVYGGEAFNGNANGNKITLANARLDTAVEVYGGSSDTGNATGNTISLSGNDYTFKVLYGGLTNSGTDAFSGNTLNIANRLTVGTMENFQYLNFTLPGNIQTNDPVIKATTANLGDASIVGSINVIPGTRAFSAGDKVTLIRSGSTIGGSLAKQCHYRHAGPWIAL